MRRSFRFLLSLFSFALPAFSQNIQWIHDYSEGMRLAKEDSRPVLLDFWSERCLPCKQMDDDLYRDPGVIEVAHRFVLIRVNSDSEPSVAERFAVEALPMKIFLDPWENILVQVKGYTKARELLEVMKPIPISFELISDSTLALEEDPDDVEALLEIGAFYRSAGFASLADRFHARAEKAGAAAKDHNAAAEAPQKPPIIPGGAVEMVPSPLPIKITVPGGGYDSPSPVIVDMSVEELLKKYPEELTGVAFGPDQNPLNSLLQGIGKNVEEFFDNFTNTISKERIRRETLRADGTVAEHVEQNVEYLILARRNEYGREWQEERTNSRGKPVKLKPLAGQSFVTYGFANTCVFFSPVYQKAIHFRHLGRESSEPNAHLIAFAQRPEMGGATTQFEMDGISTSVWVQGLAWVDPITYQILRMRTDLLQPQPQVGLNRMSTDISYGEYRFSEKGLSLWLPREVVVTIIYRGEAFRNFHRYSDYRLFTVESHEKHEPIPRPQVPK